MRKPYQIVILPGLDGTGIMLQRFSAALAADFRVKTICYPPLEPLNYDGLLEWVRKQLPANDFIVIGESFSGPLALRLGQERIPGLQGIILGASFAKLDVPLKFVMKRLARMVSPRLIPSRMLTAYLMGKGATPELRQQLKEVLRTVASEVWQVRAAEALSVDLFASGQTISQPVLYLRATKDQLVPKSAAQRLAGIAPDLFICDIDAPHFLFQLAYEDCIAAIRHFSKRLAEK